MARKNPEDTKRYNRDRCLKLISGETIVKKPKIAKKTKELIKVGQRIDIGPAICVLITNHFYDFAIEDFIGHAPLIRVDRKAMERWVKKQEKKRRKK